MTVLCDFDRSLIDETFALAMARLPQPIGPEACALCRELERPCLVHRTASDWPQVRTAPRVSP